MSIATHHQRTAASPRTAVLDRTPNAHTTLIVIAKEPIAGRVKTRLHPAVSFEQAAELAAASIDDTLAAMAHLPFARRILAFDGTMTPAGSEEYEVIPQVSGDLDARLAAVFDECEGQTLLIGMDTPQVRPLDIAPVLERWPLDIDAWFGPATDGGFWALALRNPDGDLIRGVPMSRDDTGAIQLARLCAAGLKVGMLRPLNDVDTIDDARAAARTAPTTRFAATLASFGMDF